MAPRRTPRTPGRPTFLTVEVEKDLLEKISGGIPIETSAALCGLGRSTLFGWLTKGKDETEARAAGNEADPGMDVYVEFFAKVNAARARAGARNVLLVQRAAEGGQIVEKRTITHPDGSVEEVEKRAAPDWRAAAWYLERTQRSQYGKDAVQVELTGADGGPVQVTATDAEQIANQVTANLARLAAGAAARAALPAADADADIEDAEVIEE